MGVSLPGIKKVFPIFLDKPELAFLDNASTTQKPFSVIQTITEFYQFGNANVHRGLYELSSEATMRYEGVRKKVKDFIGAKSEKEISFTKGTTESINIVANSFTSIVNEGDNIIISAMEHHANLIPWQQLCLRRKANLRIIPVNQEGDLELGKLGDLLDSRTKMLAITHISNTLGTINPLQEIISAAHNRNVPVLVDAAQSIGHQKFSLGETDADFLVFSAHKMFGPMGTGVLYAKEKHHHLVQPLHFGGGAIREVMFNETKFMDFPHSLEAGTPHVVGVLGLGAALDFLNDLNLPESFNHTHQLALIFKEKLRSLKFVKVVGNPKEFGCIVPFIVDGIHPHDVAGFLDEHHIAMRAGHHCTQPLHEALGLTATVRASFSIYNTPEDVDKTIVGLHELKKFWS